MADKTDDKMDLEFVLNELGEVKQYQLFVFVYLAVTIIVSAIYNCQYVFAAGPIDYRCRVPMCESTPEKFETTGWGKFALPAPGPLGADCFRYRVIGKTCEPASFANTTEACYSWVYRNHETIVAEFNMACEDWRRTLVGTMHGAGVFAAMPATAFVSDILGRKHALVGTSIAPAIFGVLRGYCNNYILYLVYEFLEALVGAGTYATAFILALEIVGLKMRVFVGNSLSIVYSFGQMLAAACAWIWPYWRTYTLIIFYPSFLFVFYYLFVDESMRWLLSKGKSQEAVNIIIKIARMNKVQLSPKALRMLEDAVKSDHVHKPGPAVEVTIAQRLEKPPESLCSQVIHSKTILYRVCVCSFWWISVTMIYYGLSINSVSLAGNKYLNFVFMSIAEVPGFMLSYLTLDRFGRKSSIMVAYFMCGLALLAQMVVTNTKSIIALALGAKTMISMIYCSIYIYTIELFPTQARHRLMGICSMTGRIGSMLAPQTPLLMRWSKALPYIVFGIMAGVAGMLMLLTPETLNLRLPDTVQQAENLSAEHTSKKTDIAKDADTLP